MKHKDKMKYLKEHDPITHAEMTSNPTGSDLDANFTACFYIGLVLLAIVLGCITAKILFL